MTGKVHRIGVISDTHGMLRAEVVELLPETLSFELLGLRIFMIHDRKELTSPEVPAADHDGSDREGGGSSRFPCGADRSGSFNRNVKIDL